MGIFSIFTDYRTASRIDLHELESRVALAASRMKRVGGDAALRREVARLDLIVEALTRVIVKAGLVTADELGRMIKSIDLEDGVADGQRKRPPRPRVLPRGRINRS